ncbi:MAG: hypothetical protein ACK41P_04265 [Asticcacaulis sp.]
MTVPPFSEPESASLPPSVSPESRRVLKPLIPVIGLFGAVPGIGEGLLGFMTWFWRRKAGLTQEQALILAGRAVLALVGASMLAFVLLKAVFQLTILAAIPVVMVRLFWVWRQVDILAHTPLPVEAEPDAEGVKDQEPPKA